MYQKKKIVAIIGSASQNSANQKLVAYIAAMTKDDFTFNILNDLKTYPHFNPELTAENTPKEIVALRKELEKADGILICTPEYIFSVPSGLKNIIEWLVSTTVLSEKPTGLITASASGEKAHQELQLIMKTVMAKFNDETTLLIQGIKGKISEHGQITDEKTKDDLKAFANAFKMLGNAGN